MGHKSISMTVRYSHLTPKHTLAAVERLAEVIPENPTDTKTSTNAAEQIPTDMNYIHYICRCKMLQARGARSSAVRAADS